MSIKQYINNKYLDSNLIQKIIEINDNGNIVYYLSLNFISTIFSPEIQVFYHISDNKYHLFMFDKNHAGIYSTQLFFNKYSLYSIKYIHISEDEKFKKFKNLIQPYILLQNLL